jgi:hypothetical protein
MTPAACGAFVHGLEDEYEEVRRATIGMSGGQVHPSDDD